MNFRRYEQWFYSSEGSEIHQTTVTSGAGYAAYSFAGTEIQKRSYPNSYGGQFQGRGYELIEELRLLEHATDTAEQAVALHSAAQCPAGKFNIILDSSQLALQIHESIGHPIELDRVLGMEANFAGASFLTLDKLRSLQYGSEIVNAVADATPAHGPGLVHLLTTTKAWRRSALRSLPTAGSPDTSPRAIPRPRLARSAAEDVCAPKTGTACPSFA